MGIPQELYVKDGESWKTTTLNGLTGLGDKLVIMQGPMYIRGSMKEEWDPEDLHYYLDISDYTGDRTIHIAAVDVISVSLPDPRYTDSEGRIYKMFINRAILKLKEKQMRRGLREVNMIGEDFGNEIIIPAAIDRQIRLMPYEQFHEERRDCFDRGQFSKPFESSVYEVLKNDPLIR